MNDGPILVVDDNVDAADTTVLLLQSLGYKAEATYDGTSALQRAESMKPAIILLDIGLPDINGVEVANRLRGSGLREIRIIALTGYGALDELPEDGFDAVLLKPVALTDLRQAIDKTSS